MATKAREIEGTWEEVVAHGAEFAGHRVRLIVLPDEEEVTPETGEISATNRRMLDDFLELQRTPLSEEDIAILEDFEKFRKEHPFTLRRTRKK